MASRMIMRPVLRPSLQLRLFQRTILSTSGSLRHSSSSAPATIVDGGFWRSLVPKPLRRESREEARLKKKPKEWNPATFFIVMFLLIGSMSIQMIALKHSFDRYVRQTNIRIDLLRNVVERIQRGEDVDVEKALGTGDPQREMEWEEVLQAIENEDTFRKEGRKQKKTEAEKGQADNVQIQALKPATASDRVGRGGHSPQKTNVGHTGNFF